MQATAEQPLNNQEIVQHLALDANQLHSGDPQAPGYVPPHERSLHQASYAWLVNRADHAEEPLVSVGERGEHVLSAESLMADTDELRAWLDDDSRTLRRAIENPVEARRAIWEGREQSGVSDSEASSHRARSGALTLEEAKTYLNTLRETTPTTDQADRDMHDASLDVTFALLDNWKHRQDPKDELEDAEIQLDLHAAPSSPEVRDSLYTHLLREQTKHEQSFHALNEARVRELGKEVLDVVGVRTRIEESLSDGAREADELRRAREQHAKLKISTSGRPAEVVADVEDDEVARYRDMFKNMNIGTGSSRTGPKQPEATSGDEGGVEEDRLAAVEAAAQSGELLGWEPQGETRAEREEWARQKARQIRELTLLPAEYRRLSKEQGALVPTIHREGYESAANARYKEIAAIGNVHNVQTDDPDIIEQILREMTPVLRKDYADDLDRVIQEVRAAHVRKPQAKFSFTFNRNADDEGSQTFGFMHTMPN